MKVITGYLIDRETGVGIPDKVVAFTNLAGAAITTATTYAQSVSSTTDADGKFSGWFELSPGPVDVEVTVSGDEVKVRKHDETAQIGAVWMSDLQRIGASFRDGVVSGYLNQMAVTTPSGHNIVIATGAAMIDGILFSIENGSMTIVGTANTNPALNPRYDLVTLRQYAADAAGQDAGRQEVVVTLGSTEATAPATPTGADFTDYPLAVVSTPYNSATKSLQSDLRTFTGNAPPIAMLGDADSLPDTTELTTSYVTFITPTITDLDSRKSYDGYLSFHGVAWAEDQNQLSEARCLLKVDSAFLLGGAITDRYVAVLNFDLNSNSEDYDLVVPFSFNCPIIGVTGVSSLALPVQFKQENISGSGSMYLASLYGYLTLRERN